MSASQARRGVPRFGVSTIVTGRAAFDQPGVPWPVEVVELCNVNQSRWRELVEAGRAPKPAVGLHCPIPFDGWVHRFDITGHDPGGQAEAIALVERTLAAAADIGADYVVTHFPSVSRHAAVAPAKARKDAVRVANRLQGLASEYGVRLLLENVGPNPYLYRGEHFRELFESTGLKMCLDFGHAHVLESEEDVYGFARAVAPHVASVHLYNATRESYRVGFHAAPARDRTPATGWMDLRALLRIMRSRAPLEFIVLEYSAAATNDTPSVTGEVTDLYTFVRETWSAPAAGE
jgi:sugar phosphate isomerase/epimerase